MPHTHSSSVPPTAAALQFSFSLSPTDVSLGCAVPRAVSSAGETRARSVSAAYVLRAEVCAKNAGRAAVLARESREFHASGGVFD